MNVVESVLSDNFRKIESEFRRMKREIENIKKNETSIIDKLNQLDPFDQLDMYEVQHTEK